MGLRRVRVTRGTGFTRGARGARGTMQTRVLNRSVPTVSFNEIKQFHQFQQLYITH